MATTNGSGSWSSGASWVGGVVPADDESVDIEPGHAILMDADLSAYTGLRTVTIKSAASGTPGMLYWKDGTSGYLKIRTGYNLAGSDNTVKGRLLANSDGVWGDAGALAVADKAVILLEGTSKIDASHLDIALYCSQPTDTFVETYKTAYTCTAQSTDVNPTTNVITFTSPPPAAGTEVKVRSTGLLPGGLTTYDIYYTRAVSGNTCKLALRDSDATVVDITTTGSGTLTMYDGHTNTSTATVNVVQDVTGDAAWTTTVGHNRAVLTNNYGYDFQRVTLSTIAAGAITLSENVDSAQRPLAQIFLSSRNVSIRSSGTDLYQAIVDFSSATSRSGIFGCEVINTAGVGTAINEGTGHSISGPISGCRTGIQSGTGHSISGSISGCTIGIGSGTGHSISGALSGCGYATYSGVGHSISGPISGCLFGNHTTVNCSISGPISGCEYAMYSARGCSNSGPISGCGYAFNLGANNSASGPISGCSYGMFFGTGYIISGDISGCSNGIYYAEFRGQGFSFVGNLVDVLYSGHNTGPLLNGVIFNYGGIANDTRAWSAGGTLIHDTIVYPVGKTYSGKFTCVDSGYWTKMEWPISRTAPLTLALTVHAKNDSTELGSTERVRWELINPASDPILGGTALITWISDDGTDWQSTVFNYTRADDRPLLIRASAKRGSGNGWIYLDQYATDYETLQQGVTTLLGRVVGTLGSGTHNPQSGDAYARLGAPAGASVSADIATRLATSGYTAPDNAAITAIKAKTDNLPADTNTLLTSTGIKIASIANGAIAAAAFAANALDAVWSTASRTLTAISDSSGITTLLSRVIGTLATGTHNPQSGDAYARLGAPAGASVSADLAAIDAAVSGLHDFDPATDAVAHVTLVDTVTTLTNSPDVPTESEIADAVRLELAAELASITAIEERLEEQVPSGPVVVIPPPGVGQTTAWTACYDEEGQIEEGVEITIICTKSTDNGAFDSTPVVLTSDEDGLAAGPIPRGAGLTFTARRGSGRPVRVTGVDAETLELPPLVGAP